MLSTLSSTDIVPQDTGIARNDSWQGIHIHQVVISGELSQVDAAEQSAF